jgi:CDP-6-deoxy-D-xylo-4-hexulose-3-dehydrase
LLKYSLASSTWGTEEIEAISRVIDSGKFTMGDEVSQFESEFASKLNSKYCVMFNSGSSANLALLTSARYAKIPLLDVGDEVIVPAVSWSTTYFPVSQIGAKLKFVDIDADTLNIDTSKIEEAITKDTKAIFVVNLLGNPADWTSLRDLAEKFNLHLFEDNCESLGATYLGKNTGTFGLGGTFSTFFSHHISTMEGGMVLTDDEILFHTLKSVRAHGWTRDLPEVNHVHDKTGDYWEDLFRFVIPGYNLRPLEIEAAIGRVQLRKLDEFVHVRRANAKLFLDSVGKMNGYRVQKEVGTSSWFGFSIILEGKLKGRRRQLIAELSEQGIESRPIVTGNFTRNPVIKHLSHTVAGSLTNSDELHDDGFFIGNHHFDLAREIEHLSQVLRRFGERF